MRIARAARLAPLVFVAVVALGARPAVADETYHVDGEADLTAADPRVAALDVAFAAAAREALRDRVSAADQKAHRVELDREVIGRARKWVSSYKVVADTATGSVRKLEVDVRVDVDKLDAKLAELGIAPPTAEVPGVEPSGAPPVGGGKRATVLLRVDSPAGVIASYGAAAERDVPGGASISAAVRAAGWQLVAAPASGPAPREGGGLLDDDSARALAGSVDADLAVIVAAEAAAPGEVRGTGERAVLARARVRVVDRAGAVVGEGAAVSGAHGGDDVVAAAVAGAVVDAFADARPGGGAVAAPVAAVSAGADEILVELVPRDKQDGVAWSVIRAIRDKLAATKGAAVGLRRLAAREVVLGVHGGGRPADKLARDLRDLEHKLGGVTLSTKVDGNTVRVRVSGSP